MKRNLVFSTLLAVAVSGLSQAALADDDVQTGDQVRDRDRVHQMPMEDQQKMMEKERKEKQEKLKSKEKEMKQDKSMIKEQVRDQDRIYGSQMMTNEERMAFRDRMRSAQTNEEREQIRREHHEEMVKRAKERGVTLPDEPPARGQKKGWGDDGMPGKSQTGGKGYGGGMGNSGKGKNQ